MKKFTKSFTEEYIKEGITNIDNELEANGFDKKDIPQIKTLLKSGELGKYVESAGKDFTFGMLNAIYKDCLEYKRVYDIRSGAYKMLIRIVPILLSPISAFVWTIGVILGSSRAVNKIIQPVIKDPGKNYSSFLTKIVTKCMSIAEGELTHDDPLKRAFVVSDGIVDMLNPATIHEFIYYLSEKMSTEDSNTKVPDFYIENELRTYLNSIYKLDPPLPLK